MCLRADLLDLPECARRLSPLRWLGALPRGNWQPLTAVVMVLIAAVVAVTGAALFQRRDHLAG
ncbi:hypothetical protein [Cryptosporangium sp. NPDC051539]|uniref:hypothetical protein n=1 Tax=Cryptosporangium sp. NPDC051539 TaxID=3363962 RepID=UPI00378AEE98